MCIRDRLAFEGRYTRWLAGADLRDDYVAACDTIGRQVRVDLGETAVEGRAVGVDADGRLLVQTASGPQAFAAGDVWHLR
jgi:BirA family biotin operon repressor/biotin-[acetyl-CoA-carboxylase] ligase